VGSLLNGPHGLVQPVVETRGKLRVNTEPRKLLKRLLRSVVASILPRSLRQEYLDALDERCTSLAKWIAESLRDIARFYRILTIAAFNKTLV